MEPQMAQLTGPLVLGGVARRPSTLQMVKEALQAQDEKKGASVFTIKQFILAKYPMEDPIRLKYLLKQALSKGLSCGELVRPHNSSAVGATGTFMLAPKEPQHKQHLGQANPDRGQALKPGQEGTTKDPCAPVAGAQRRGKGLQGHEPPHAAWPHQDSSTTPSAGTTKQQLTAMKQKPKAKPMDAQPRAAVKPGSDGAKPPRAANHPQAPGTGCSRPPRAADHPQALGKGCSRPCGAEAAGRSKSDSSVGAGTKGPQKVPGGKSKGKVLKGAQQGPPKAQRGQGQARKPRVTPGARQGEARLQKAASPGEDRTALSGDPDSLT
ncbi:PREDICTED: protein B4 isoform X1 [Lepidothrix coronata]|uniref:Protein B4 isoform X1 n=2 Tax=Lepidothrix coronata TaxID=321398 RepID=A0A6J0I9C1_9PASS|nr:PREDICTED: protein B4 isoform X1 [Lepidothrix coronata]